MQRITMPNPPAVWAEPRLNLNLASPRAPQATSITPYHLTFGYEENQEARGTYYTVAGQNGQVLATGGRPILPLHTTEIASPDNGLVHGVLILGGTFSDWPDFNPVVTSVISEENTLIEENSYPSPNWYPSSVASNNHLVTVQGELLQRLVVVPAQFLATNVEEDAETVGVLRRYNSLELEVYSTPFEEADFVAPQIFRTSATLTGNILEFEVEVADETSGVERVVILYRGQGQRSWSRAELGAADIDDVARGSVIAPFGGVEYFVQAVDASGNVALATESGAPFVVAGGSAPATIFLPLITRP
jgi:hypothetical protein